MNYRALDDLFSLVHERGDTTKYTVAVSVLEIYNEQCRDLLADQGGHKIEILATGRAGQNTPDAIMHEVWKGSPTVTHTVVSRNSMV